MSKSYTRKCRNCGTRIQLRQMPHGQWVAFEGYDTVHDCSKPSVQEVKKESIKLSSKEKPKDKSFLDLDISEFSIDKKSINNPTQVEKMSLGTLGGHAYKEPTKPAKIDYRDSSENRSSWQERIKKKDEDVSGHIVVGVILIIIFAIIVLTSLCSLNNSATSSQNKMSAGAIEINKTSTKIFTPQNQPKPTSTTNKKQLSTATAKTSSDSIKGCLDAVSSLSIRECPGTDSKVIGYLFEGECVDIIGRDASNIWGYLKGGGWLNTHYLKLEKNTENLLINGCVLD